MRSIKCEKCGFEIQAANFKRHNSSCDGRGPKKATYKPHEGDYTCDRCGRVFQTRDSYAGHRGSCGRSRFVSEEGRKRQGWNRGLTKETDSRVAKGGLTCSITQTGKPGKPHTQESRDKMSMSRTKYVQRTGGNVPYYEVQCGDRVIKVQGTWELRVANKLNSIGIRWERKVVRFDVIRRYTPDFFLPDLGVFLEVKGLLKSNDIWKMNKALEDNPGMDLRMIWKLPALLEFESHGDPLRVLTFSEQAGMGERQTQMA